MMSVISTHSLQDAYVQWTAKLVIADGQLNLSQEFVLVV